MRNILIFVLLLATVVLFSCRSDKGNTSHGVKPAAVAKSDEVKDTSAIETELSYDDLYLKGKKHLRDIISSIVNGNKKKLASLCIYPIRREYPLPDIENSAQMEKYFNVIFDKSFRKWLKDIGEEGWSYNGLNHFGFTCSGEMRVSELLYEVNYLSEREQKKRRKLITEEINSLHKSLRGGWMPFFCYKEVKDGSVIRIDRKEDKFRLAKYNKGRKASDLPDLIVYGKVIASSGGPLYYDFANAEGDSISFCDNVNYDDGLFLNRNGVVTIEYYGRIKCYNGMKKCYWLDEMKNSSGKSYYEENDYIS